MSPDVKSLLVNWWKAKSEAVVKLDAQGRSGIGAQARDAKHMQSLAAFVRQMFLDAGLSEDEVATDTVIPGYFRRSKNWDVVAIHKGHLVGVVELKSQEKSPGNNANNRIEEAIGSVVDAKTVQDIGEAFGKLGVWAAWCMTFNRDCEPQRRNGVRSKHFPLDPAFATFSYAGQYGTAIERLISQNLYQAGWMIRTWVNDNGTVDYDEPIPTATAETLATQIEARVKFAVQALRKE